MAKSGTGQSGRGDRGTRQRSVTIDLPAEEVPGTDTEDRKADAGPAEGAQKPAAAKAATPGGDAETKAPSPSTKPEEPAPAKAEASTPAQEAKAKAAVPKTEAPKPATPKAEGSSPAQSARGQDIAPKTEAPAAPAAASQASTGPESKAAPRHDAKAAEQSRASTDRAPPPPRRSVVPVVVSGLLGGVVGAILVFVLAVAGVFAVLEDEDLDLAGELEALSSEFAELERVLEEQALAPLREDVAALEQWFNELQDTAPLEAAIDEGLTALDDRLTRLEGELASISEAALTNGEGALLAPEIAALESDLAALSQGLDALASEAAASADESIAGIESRLDAFDGELQGIAGALDRAAALGPAIAADALAAAVETGRPFTEELAALTRLNADRDVLALLEPHAESGLPTLAALNARFETEVAAVDLSSPVPEGASALDRLIGSARGLVEVRPADPTAGPDPAAIVTRIRGALSSGDLAMALSEWEALPEDIKAETAGWAEMLKTRVAADDLVAKLRAAALAPLGAAE